MQWDWKVACMDVRYRRPFEAWSLRRMRRGQSQVCDFIAIYLLTRTSDQDLRLMT